MNKVVWFKIGAVAALWMLIGGAALSGWMIGRSEAARQISEWRQRLAVDTAPKASCGIEVELIEARTDKDTRTDATAAPAKGEQANLFGLKSGGIWPGVPQHLHLREMLTTR